MGYDTKHLDQCPIAFLYNLHPSVSCFQIILIFILCVILFICFWYNVPCNSYFCFMLLIFVAVVFLPYFSLTFLQLIFIYTILNLDGSNSKNKVSPVVPADDSSTSRCLSAPILSKNFTSWSSCAL